MKQILLLFSIISYVVSESSNLAVLHAEGQHKFADFCALYNPHFGRIQEHLDQSPKYEIYLAETDSGCAQYKDVRESWNKTIFVKVGNCSAFEKELYAKRAGASQVILIGDEDNDLNRGDKDQYGQITIPVGMILHSSWNVLQTLGDPVTVQLYHPHDPPFDPNLLVIWFIAVFTVVSGGYWMGRMTEERFYQDPDSHLIDDNNEDDFDITPGAVIIFVILICSFLLLLYFFYKYLIYVIIGLFGLASWNGTFECFRGVWGMLSCGRCKLPSNNLPIFKSQPEIKDIFLLIFCFGLSLWWLIVRNESYGWVLQDILGVCFCISLIKMIKLPNLKIGTILLVALLLYDIFFVFITPFFSARGKSVMVEVATGKGHTEQLPMVIRVPKLIHTPLSVCELPFSLLGFGDILLPGIFIAFCHNFDVMANTPHKIYFTVTCIGYGIGLLITFVALLAMKVGQPALLYLVPCVLLSTLITGWIRGEIKALWTGKIDESKVPKSSNNDPSVKTENGITDDDNTSNMKPDASHSQEADERDSLLEK